MAAEKTKKTAPKRATNTAKSKEVAADSATLEELKGLLEIFAKIPEERRAALLKRAQREAAGEILTEEAVEEERKKLARFFAGIKDTRKKKLIARKVEEIAGDRKR